MPAGDPVAVDGAALGPAALLERLNQLGGANGIGRVDLVENRFVGMKSRGVYETPGGTILIAAHRAMESLTLDRAAAHLKDELMPRYAELVYNGFWFAPERRMLQAAIDESQRNVTGTVRLTLYKGSVTVEGRKAPQSLYSAAHATFEADSVYDQRDAEGFIKLNALRLQAGQDGRGHVARKPRREEGRWRPNRLLENSTSGGGAHRPPLMEGATGSALMRVARNTSRPSKRSCDNALRRSKRLWSWIMVAPR